MYFQTDKPVPPGEIGTRLFCSGITDDMRQEARDRLFSVTRQQLVDVTNRYDKYVFIYLKSFIQFLAHLSR